MIQELFRIGDFAISPFGVMLVAALFSAYVQLSRGMKRLGVGDDEDASTIIFYCGVGGILGGKIYYAILHGDPRLLIDRAGIVWYGCFLAGLLAFFWVARSRRLPIPRTLDAVGPALALGYGVGRIGCFVVGDDYGVPTNLPWGIAFKNGLPSTTPTNLSWSFGIEVPPEMASAEYVKVHPTQLYEVLLGLIIWQAALWFSRRDPLPRPGNIFLLSLTLLSLERFGIEFLRAKDDRFLGVFTLAQAISILILIVIAILAWRRRRVPLVE